MARAIPRAFEYTWGKGQIVEEASFGGEYKESAIQLLEYEDGSLNVRFCFYNDRGQFQRSPLLVGEEDLVGLKKALKGCPRLKAMLKTLVG